MKIDQCFGILSVVYMPVDDPMQLLSLEEGLFRSLRTLQCCHGASVIVLRQRYPLE